MYLSKLIEMLTTWIFYVDRYNVYIYYNINKYRKYIIKINLCKIYCISSIYCIQYINNKISGTLNRSLTKKGINWTRIIINSTVWTITYTICAFIMKIIQKRLLFLQENLYNLQWSQLKVKLISTSYSENYQWKK